jgi:translation initiation factor 2B subunit (eIF-2B alpha/beta/delta family)
VVSGIAVDHLRHEIKVDFIQYTGPNQRNFTVIKRYVLNEIEDELASVEKTLAFGGISSFHLVTSSAEVTLVGDYQGKLKDSIERVLGWAQLTPSPNSTAITVAALGALQALVDQTIETRKKEPSEALETLRSGLQRLIQSLRHQLRTRCCHNELHRIFESLNCIYEAIQFKEELDDTVVTRLGVFAQRFMTLVRPNPDRHVKLAEELATVLQKLNSLRVATEPWTFLLYGCSDSVATVLASFARERRLRLCIAEGRPKTHHGARNVPTYIDAEAYVERLHSLGIKPENMSIIPDATIASTMDVGRKGLLPQFDAVILGANGIYLEPEMMVSHSAGHLMRAICAKEFGIPVVILGASTKLSSRPERGEGKAVRHSQWFSSDEAQRERIKEYGANTDWNLREDRIPLSFVDALITDRGTIFPKESNDQAKDELGRQMNELDSFLETRAFGISDEAASSTHA